MGVAYPIGIGTRINIHTMDFYRRIPPQRFSHIALFATTNHQNLRFRLFWRFFCQPLHPPHKFLAIGTGDFIFTLHHLHQPMVQRLRLGLAIKSNFSRVADTIAQAGADENRHPPLNTKPIVRLGMVAFGGGANIATRHHFEAGVFLARTPPVNSFADFGGSHQYCPW